MRLVRRLIPEWRNECRALLIPNIGQGHFGPQSINFWRLITSLTALPFTHLWSSFECGFTIGLDESVKSRSTYVAARCIDGVSFSLRSQNEHAFPRVTETGPSTKGILPVVESPPTTTALRSNSWAGVGQQLTSVPPNWRGHRFILRTWSSLTLAGWR